MDARESPERIHAHARIVRHGGQSRFPGGVTGLRKTVFDEGFKGFGTLRNAQFPLRQDRHAHGRKHCAKFPKFPRVVRREHEFLFRHHFSSSKTDRCAA